MNIGIIGAGYVGLVTGACFAHLGNKVFCVDNDEGKIKTLLKGQIPIYEPGLPEMLARLRKKGRITFSTDIASIAKKCKVIFICVGTPPRVDGSADLSAVEIVARTIAKNLKHYVVIVEKSTVPVETGERVRQVIELEKPRKVSFDVASNPEFLKEGTAIEDFLNPDRVVIGVSSEKAKKVLSDLYKPLKAPIMVTDIKSAELIKHASNSFLATKIAYANALSRICDRIGADVSKVTEGMGMDKRIGSAFLKAGIGSGGFCLPKDLDAFYHISRRIGYDFKMLQAVKEINDTQKDVVIQKLEEELWNLNGKTIAVLGLAFKPNTDDIRFAPSLDIIKSLLAFGVNIRTYDPIAAEKTKSEMGTKGIYYAKNAYDAVHNAHGLILATEWNEFKKLDFKKIKKTMALPIIIDGRNLWKPEDLQKLGFRYRSIGRDRLS
ncbi:UDP-glucose dehydrogenase family protein [Elusimicrobiota bacterium]